MANSTGRRREILTMVQESEAPLEIAAIAERLQVHPNTVRFHLEALTGAGQVERATPVGPAGPGRPPLVFRARRVMNPDGPRNYELLASILADSLSGRSDPVAAAIETGRDWGSRTIAPARARKLSDQQAIGQLTGLLDGLGFAAETRRSVDGRSQIGLRHCPFFDLVQTQGQVICPLHLGLMQGALSALPTRVTVDELVPFAEPDLCLVLLGREGGEA